MIGLDEFLEKSIPIGKLLNYFLSNVKFDKENVNIFNDLKRMAFE